MIKLFMTLQQVAYMMFLYPILLQYLKSWGRLAELTKALYLTIGMSLGTVPWFETRQNR